MNKEKNLIKIINKVRYFNLIQITKKKTTNLMKKSYKT